MFKLKLYDLSLLQTYMVYDSAWGLYVGGVVGK